MMETMIKLILICTKNVLELYLVVHMYLHEFYYEDEVDFS